jgi:hypothetical protein
MTLFIGAGIIVYLGLFVWILKTKLRNKIPYIVIAAVSIVLINCNIYTASRTIGVPIVGVEYYIGKLDMVNKVLQVIMIGISVYLIFAIGKTMIKERIEERKRERYILLIKIILPATIS